MKTSEFINLHQRAHLEVGAVDFAAVRNKVSGYIELVITVRHTGRTLSQAQMRLDTIRSADILKVACLFTEVIDKPRQEKAQHYIYIDNGGVTFELYYNEDGTLVFGFDAQYHGHPSGKVNVLLGGIPFEDLLGLKRLFQDVATQFTNMDWDAYYRL